MPVLVKESRGSILLVFACGDARHSGINSFHAAQNESTGVHQDDQRA
jgi:hypothetical protein